MKMKHIFLAMVISSFSASAMAKSSVTAKVKFSSEKSSTKMKKNAVKNPELTNAKKSRKTSKRSKRHDTEA